MFSILKNIKRKAVSGDVFLMTTPFKRVLMGLPCSYSSHIQGQPLYDLQTYQLPLSSEESKIILDKINSATMEELLQYKLSVSLASKLVSARRKKSNFVDMKQLILVEGIGLKKIEEICYRILNSNGKLMESNYRGKGYGKTYVQPVLSENYFQWLPSIVGLSLGRHFVSWCELRRGCSMSATTHNKDTQESWFLSRVGHSHINTSKLDQMEVYVEVQQLVDGLPASCLYALPERPHAGKSIITAPSIGHLLGLLAVMLDEKAQRCRADAHVMSRAAPSGPATSSCEQGGDSSHEFRVCYARDGLFKRALVMQTPNKRLLGLHAINWLLNPAAPDCVSATASDTFSTSIPDSSTSTPGCSTSIPDSSTSTPGSFTSTSWSSSAAAVQGPSLCSAHILELTRKSSSSSCTQQLPPLHLLPSVLAQYRHWPRATQSSVSDAVSVTLACLAQR